MTIIIDYNNRELYLYFLTVSVNFINYYLSRVVLFIDRGMGIVLITNGFSLKKES